MDTANRHQSTQPTPTIAIVIVGATGRIGRRIDALAAGHNARVAARTSRATPRHTPAPVPEGELGPVVVDFSSPEALPLAVALADAPGASLLVGTTGHDPAHRAMLDELATRRPVLVAPNTAPACCAMRHAVARLARALGPAYSAAIVELHRQGKADAPSGTARTLAAAIASGAQGPPPPEAIASVRSGSIMAEHRVRFDGPGETLELVHRAHGPDLFAHGALHAARWLARAGPGMHSMDDVLGLAGGEV